MKSSFSDSRKYCNPFPSVTFHSRINSITWMIHSRWHSILYCSLLLMQAAVGSLLHTTVLVAHLDQCDSASWSCLKSYHAGPSRPSISLPYSSHIWPSFVEITLQLPYSRSGLAFAVLDHWTDVSVSVHCVQWGAISDDAQLGGFVDCDFVNG